MRDDRERQLLAPLLERSETAAIICDIDGTIAPIAARAQIVGSGPEGLGLRTVRRTLRTEDFGDEPPGEGEAS